MTEATPTESVELTIVDPPRAVLPCDAVAVTVPEEFDTVEDTVEEESDEAGDGSERDVQLRGIRTLEDARLFVPSSVEGCK